MRVHVLTLFPGAFRGFLDESIVRIAREKGLLEVELVDFRRFATDRHRTVDDRPYGGGPGMVLKPEPIFAAVEDVERRHGPMPRILLTPQGEPLRQRTLEELARLPQWLVLCGRYEGIDERVRTGLDWREISIGDYVLAGGEVPAMVLLEGTARLLPGVLGDAESAVRESFQGPLLDHPHYTRPPVFRGMEVPEVLLSGDHAAIEAWRREQAIRRTRERRPDLAGEEAGAGPAPEPNEEVTDDDHRRDPRRQAGSPGRRGAGEAGETRR